MRGKPSRRSHAGRRPLLTFRLDGERRQRVRARLAGEGRTMSEVVILGLELYVQHKLSMRSVPADEDPEGARPAVPAEPAAHAGPADRPPPGHETGVPGTGGPGVIREDEAIPPDAEGTAPGPETTAVASLADLTLPDHLAARLRELRESGQSDLLSATLAGLYEAGWPLRPLAQALGISRQAVQARIRQEVA